MRRLVLLTAFIISLHGLINGQNPLMLKKWEFRQVGYSKWYNARIPGTVHSDLLLNKLIDDPYYRDNERSLQWIDKVDWEYRTFFTSQVEWQDVDQLEIIFEGLDTYADIFLNNKLVASACNMFIPITVSINPSHLKDTNELKVLLKSPVIEGLRKLQVYQLPLPADNDQSETGGMGPNKVSVFTRKAPYHFGWDWGPRLVTSGIWKPVKIQAHHYGRITDLHVRSQKITKQVANLELDVELSLKTSPPISLEISINDVVVKTVSVNTKIDGNNEVEQKRNFIIPLEIREPKLWWPNGHGDQNLYNIKVVMNTEQQIIDIKQFTTGLKTVQLVRKPDSKGESFYFEVNGKPVFAKGANYIPQDVFLPNVTQERYHQLLTSAKEANINMLRVWGGGIYENDYFYDLCDQYGIMVWQDFMFACAMYPGNTEFLKEVSEEAKIAIKRLRNHPCIVLWCGNNEIEQAWGPYDENRGWGWKQRYSTKERNRIWKAYDTIFHYILPEQVKIYNPSIPYWHSSPSAGLGKLASHTNTSGDMHYWGVWHGKEPISDYTKYRSRFMSEYGFQSFPEFESIKKFTEPEDWSIESTVMKAHQRSGIGNQRIMDYLLQSYKKPQSFEELLYVSQILQAEAINKAIRYHRSDMPYCMGSLYWQLNDCWPAASWSGIDYYGRWKALHYFAKQAFKKQIVFVDINNNTIEIKGVSDTEGGKAVLNVNLMDFQGKSLWNRPFSVTLPSNSSKLLASIDILKLPALQNKTNAFLYITLKKGSKIIDSQAYYLSEPKDLNLPYPDLKIHIRERENELNDSTMKQFLIEITSKNLCKNLMLISEGNAYSFSDNFFDIMPGETKVVSAKSDLSYSEFFRKLSYLHLEMIK